MKILLVEDHVAVATISCNLLRELHDHEVKHAADGAAALAAMEQFRPDVVLLDLNLPDMSGYEVAVRIRQRAEWQSTILVALTAFGNEIDTRMAARAGIDAHFRKPMNFELLTTLKRTEAHAQAMVSPLPGPECPKR